MFTHECTPEPAQELMDYERYYGEPVVREGARERHVNDDSASGS